MKTYAYKEDIFEVIQWTGNNLEEVKKFVKEGAPNQSVKKVDDSLFLFKDNRAGYPAGAEKGDYIVKEIEYGECSVEDSHLFSFVSEVEVKNDS